MEAQLAQHMAADRAADVKTFHNWLTVGVPSPAAAAAVYVCPFPAPCHAHAFNRSGKTPHRCLAAAPGSWEGQG